MIEILVNGTKHTVDAAPDAPLLYVLRNDLNLTGAKFGCGLGQCGACTVHLDGEAVRSCSVPVSSVGTKSIVTIEGLGAEYANSRGLDPKGATHPVQDTFIEEQAAQCGYCTTGMVMTAAALLRTNKNASEEIVRGMMAGNLCRCSVHLRILSAIKSAAARMA